MSYKDAAKSAYDSIAQGWAHATDNLGGAITTAASDVNKGASQVIHGVQNHAESTSANCTL